MRANLYGKSQIIVGDTTSHGGVVLTGSPTNTWHGIPIARKGDVVSCPKCAPFKFQIAEGLENCTDTDAALPIAVEGHKTTCGAILMAEAAPAAAVLAATSLIDAGNRRSMSKCRQLKENRKVPCREFFTLSSARMARHFRAKPIVKENVRE